MFSLLVHTTHFLNRELTLWCEKKKRARGGEGREENGGRGSEADLVGVSLWVWFLWAECCRRGLASVVFVGVCLRVWFIGVSLRLLAHS